MTLSACSANFSRILRLSASPSCAVQSMPALAPHLESHHEQVQSGKGTRKWDPFSKELLVEKVPTRERNALVSPVVYRAVGYGAVPLAVLSAMIPPMIAEGKKWEAMEMMRGKTEIIALFSHFETQGKMLQSFPWIFLCVFCFGFFFFLAELAKFGLNLQRDLICQNLHF